jgi:hypothetical protein
MMWVVNRRFKVLLVEGVAVSKVLSCVIMKFFEYLCEGLHYLIMC